MCQGPSEALCLHSLIYSSQHLYEVSAINIIIAEREVGGGTGMGNTCKTIADSCQCMTKTTTIL